MDIATAAAGTELLNAEEERGDDVDLEKDGDDNDATMPAFAHGDAAASAAGKGSENNDKDICIKREVSIVDLEVVDGAASVGQTLRNCFAICCFTGVSMKHNHNALVILGAESTTFVHKKIILIKLVSCYRFAISESFLLLTCAKTHVVVQAASSAGDLYIAVVISWRGGCDLMDRTTCFIKRNSNSRGVYALKFV